MGLPAEATFCSTGLAALSTAAYGANGYWNALELSVRYPMGHGVFISGAYTWQHALAQTSGTTLFNGGTSLQDSYHPRNDYGNSAVNVPQIFTFSGIWTLPWFHNASGFKSASLGGWQYSDLTTIQSGFLSARDSHSPPRLSDAAERNKTFHITEHQGLEFRAEFFNVFNHANFSMSRPASGQATMEA